MDQASAYLKATTDTVKCDLKSLDSIVKNVEEYLDANEKLLQDPKSQACTAVENAPWAKVEGAIAAEKKNEDLHKKMNDLQDD